MNRGLKGTYGTIVVGHRKAIGMRMVPLTSDDLWHDTKHWYRLLSTLRNPARLKVEFRQPPAADTRLLDVSIHASNAHFGNTLPVSLEWRGKDPYAVIETVTAWELMIAAAWADVVGRAEKQICAGCNTRFTWPRRKKYCLWECGHLIAVRKYKRKQALLKREAKIR